MQHFELSGGADAQKQRVAGIVASVEKCCAALSTIPCLSKQVNHPTVSVLNSQL
jgi:hypothetical protein